MKKTFLLLVLAMLSIVGAKAYDDEVIITFTDEDVTDGTYYYKLFVSDKAVDYSYAVDESYNTYGMDYWTGELTGDFDAYVVKKSISGYSGKAALTRVSAVPAGTPVVIRVKATGEYIVGVADEEYAETVENDLVVADADITINKVYGGEYFGATLGLDEEDKNTVVFAVNYNENLSAGDIYLSYSESDSENIYGNIEIVFGEIDNSAQDVANIAGLAMASGNVSLTLTNVKVTYVNVAYDDEEYNGTVVIEDESGAFKIDSEGLASKVKVGDVLNGKLGLSITSVWGLTITTVTSLDTFDDDVLVTAGTVVPTDISNADDDFLETIEWRYVTLKDFATTKVTTEDYYGNEMEVPGIDTEDLLGYPAEITDELLNVFSLSEDDFPIETGTTVDATGFIIYDNTIPYFQPTAITTPVTIGAEGVATFSSKNRLDFSNAKNIEAFIATVSGTDVTFTQVTTVPAGTGLLLRSKTGGAVTEDISVVAEEFDDTKDNALVPSTGSAVTGNYILANGSNGVGFYKAGATNKLAAGKTYLEAPASVRFITLDGNATGIAEVEAAEEDAPVYNLAGQRVAKAVKGLSIVGGKKVIVK